MFEYSTADKRHYYTISDKRPTGAFYWTQGKYNGYNALQCSTKAYKDTTQYKQLFYMMPGSDDMHFRLYTYQGEPVDYVKGKAGSSWNKGNPSPIVEMPFLQYATEKAGEFQVIKTDKEGYYSFASDGILMNDRGTGNGAAANMKWVISTYSGNNITDPGSIYKFTSVSNPVTGIETLEADVRHMTRQELASAVGVKLYDTKGRRMKNVNAVSNGFYIVKASSDSYKIYLH